MTADLSAVRGFLALLVVVGLGAVSAGLAVAGHVAGAALVGYLALVAFAVSFDATFPPSGGGQKMRVEGSKS